jgi:hypothetical protein
VSFFHVLSSNLKCEKEEREYKMKGVVRKPIFKEAKKFFVFLRFPGSAFWSSGTGSF